MLMVWVAIGSYIVGVVALLYGFVLDMRGKPRAADSYLRGGNLMVVGGVILHVASWAITW